MITRRFIVIAAVLAAAALLAACGGAAATPEPLNVTIKGQDIKFDVTTLTARVGQTVNVTYTNEGALEHTFVIDGLVAEQKVVPGQTVNFSFTPTTAGPVKYYCNVPGHELGGMVGTLTVNP